jgi:hypothetical protein
MRKIINKRTTKVAPATSGFTELLKIYSPSCVVANCQERAGCEATSVLTEHSLCWAGMTVAGTGQSGGLPGCYRWLKLEM